ncbi:MAG: helix-turn-helix domain-containing protein [Alphaproteobacteria bacterium]|nr:helix-turn-helix domain-containing protein [Marinicaulis sp.]NOX96118.1 helix-turn-helix domain-containing protein [Alphaproteobacteria bacterium]
MAHHDVARVVKRGELAMRVGCHLETIRYYEKTGLMPEPARTEAGHRVYDGDQERRLRFILRARDLGFSIEELKGLLSLVDSDHLVCGEVYELTRVHIADIREKITDLRRLEKTLSTISAKCARGNTPDCPIIDALFT